MLEHVGLANYSTLGSIVKRCLKPDGIGLIHSIGRSHPQKADAWIVKYIFPGGYFPALSEVSFAIEKAGLWVTDIEVLRLHYAETLRRWRSRMMENLPQIRALGLDESFLRMWDFYLCYCEGGFEERQIGLVQAVFEKSRARRASLLGEIG